MVLFLSGMLKIMDPVGTGFIVEAYLNFFHLGFLSVAARYIGWALSLGEAFVGAALIAGVWRVLTGIVSGMLMLAFTLITLALLIFNPPMDCGCFGEALHLSHTWSFLKNVALDLLLAASYFPWHRADAPCPLRRYASFSIAALTASMFLVYSEVALPLVDFTPFAPGSELNLTPFGDVEPAASSPAAYGLSVGTDPAASGRVAPESDGAELYPADTLGEYDDSLLLRGDVLVIAVHSPFWAAGTETGEAIGAALSAGMTPVVLSPLTLPEFSPYSYSADRRDIMTLCRSNGGAVWISDGRIVKKWPALDLPGGDELKACLSDGPDAALHRGLKSRFLFELVTAGPLLLLLLI